MFIFFKFNLLFTLRIIYFSIIYKYIHEILTLLHFLILFHKLTPILYKRLFLWQFQFFIFLKQFLLYHI